MKPEVNLYVYATFPDGQVLQVGRNMSMKMRHRSSLIRVELPGYRQAY